MAVNKPQPMGLGFVIFLGKESYFIKNPFLSYSKSLV